VRKRVNTRVIFFVNKKPPEVAALSGLLTIMIRLIQQVCLVVMYSEKENILRIWFTLGNVILSLLYEI